MMNVTINNFKYNIKFEKLKYDLSKNIDNLEDHILEIPFFILKDHNLLFEKINSAIFSKSLNFEDIT